MQALIIFQQLYSKPLDIAIHFAIHVSSHHMTNNNTTNRHKYVSPPQRSRQSRAKSLAIKDKTVSQTPSQRSPQPQMTTTKPLRTCITSSLLCFVQVITLPGYLHYTQYPDHYHHRRTRSAPLHSTPTHPITQTNNVLYPRVHLRGVQMDAPHPLHTLQPRANSQPGSTSVSEPHEETAA